MTRSRNHLRGYPGVSIHREWTVPVCGGPGSAVHHSRKGARAAPHPGTHPNAASIKRPAVSRHLRSTAKEPKNVGARSSARDRCATGASTISTMTSEPNRTYRA
jgi:hypothetical protein